MSILKFVKENNKNVIEINFVLQKEYKNIFDDDFSVDNIVKEHNNKRFFFGFRTWKHTYLLRNTKLYQKRETKPLKYLS